MKITREAELRSLICSQNRSDILVQPIETGSIALGVPDLFIQTFELAFWVELKIVRERDHGLIKFQPTQLTWHRRLIKAHGIPLIMVYDSFNDIYFITYEAFIVNSRLKGSLKAIHQEQSFLLDELISEAGKLKYRLRRQEK